MSLSVMAAFALLATGPADLAAEKVGFEPLLEGRNAAAVAEIEANAQLEADDPVRLINLGVAYARQGRTEEARALFEAAMQGEDRVALETASGEWMESRHLAKLALKMLDEGEFRTERMASR
jgi:tetratricopeptide (TPR) repeat protein